MEVAQSREVASVDSPNRADSTILNGNENFVVDDSFLDDGRSSSLSEIDDVSDDEASDDELPHPAKPVPENESEAETERVDDSPNNVREKRNIILSSGAVGPSPSKLAQSTTYSDVEDDEEEHAAVDSPSKPEKHPRNDDAATENAEGTPQTEVSTFPTDPLIKKRKREKSDDDTGTEPGEDEPLKRRRGSVKSDLSEPPAEDKEDAEGTPLSPHPADQLSRDIDESTPADDIHELDVSEVPTKAKQAKNKRSGKKDKEVEEETETGDASGDHIEDDEHADRGDEANDIDTVSKREEECKLEPLVK